VPEATLRSQFAFRDAESEEALEAIVGRRTTSRDVEHVLTSVVDACACRNARAWVYVANEGVLAHPAGKLLRSAARHGSLSIVFDLGAGGMTRVLLRALEADAQGQTLAFRYVDRRGRSSFHPKLMSFDVESTRGAWTVTLVGSGNLTLGGLRTNDELGVLSVRPRSASPTGWPELDEAVVRYARDGHVVDETTPLPETALDQRTNESEHQHPFSALRDYQRDAVERLVEAYVHARPAKWRGALLALPPAAGKTAIALVAVLQLFEKQVRRALWISPEPELARQAFHELRRIAYRGQRLPYELEAYFVTRTQVLALPEAEELDAKGVDVVRAIVRHADAPDRQMIFVGKGKLAKLDVSLEAWADLVIVDEAHHAIASEWSALLEGLRPRTVFGLTATPYVSRPDTESTTTLLNRFPLGRQAWLDYFPKPRRPTLESSLPKRGAGGAVAFAESATTFLQKDRERLAPLRVLAEPKVEVLELRDAQGERVVVRPKGGGAQPPHRRLEHALAKLEDEGLTAGTFDGLSSVEQITRYRTRHLHDKGTVADPAGFAEALAVVDADALEHTKRAMQTGLVVLFARGTGHAALLEKQAEWLGLPRDGLLVVHTKDGRPPGLRRFEVRNLAKRGRGALICVDMLSEGTDLRKADTVILTRWTTSERLHWQMAGRGLRGPGSGGTPHVTLRLFDLEFVVRDNETETAVLGGASRVLVDELESAGVEVKRSALQVGAIARPPGPRDPSARKRERGRAPASRSNSRSTNSWHHGEMTIDGIEKLRDLPEAGYEYWIVSPKGNPVTDRQQTRNPFEAVRRRRKRYGRTGYRYQVVRKP
jgi:superfamily II DNA or RNA helicase